ncbi:hypothetical protein PIB30_062794 [Stylosanthes scabra]|uniref:CCHC-type domain-containing protein n=1 Tax=Stylosanthes scabra TaxID=79078 RepID=A0ABU6TML2_9FABA|nr:hypothetical protein [Stylosanthes scabra]
MGAKSHSLFDYSVSGLVRLADEVEARLNSGPVAEDMPKAESTVKDPVVVRTKGAPKIPKKARGKKRRCTKCRKPGHTKRHCGDKAEEGTDTGLHSGFESAEHPSQGSSPSNLGPRSGSSKWRSPADGAGCVNEEGPIKVGPNVSSAVMSDSSEEDEFLQGVMTNISALSDLIVASLSRR